MKAFIHPLILALSCVALALIGYGYLWWIDVIVVVTSDSYVDWERADEQERGVAALVGGYILPAAVD